MANRCCSPICSNPPFYFRFKRAWALALILTLLMVPSAYALKVGDVVDPSLMTSLGISPDKITVVSFFAEWCESCRKELPLLSSINSRSNQAKVEFLGVDTDDNPSAAAMFQERLRAANALNFRVYNDVRHQVVAAFRPKGFPSLYLIKDGKIVKVYEGANPAIDSLIERDLAALGGV